VLSDNGLLTKVMSNIDEYMIVSNVSIGLPMWNVEFNCNV